MGRSDKSGIRRNAMMEHILASPITTPGQLAEHFGVSTETVRKDLDYLVKKGKVHKIHGGVVAVEQQSYEKPHVLRSVENIEQKKRIAKAACALIEPGDTIIIENGTTMDELARSLCDNIDLLSAITIITMSFRIADIFKNFEKLRLFFIGGWLRPGDLLAYGQYTLNILKDFNVDKAFISGAGLNESLMVTDYFDEEVILRRQIIKGAKHTILLMDSSKLYKTRLMNVCPVTDTHHLITDDGCSPWMKKAVEGAGVAVTLAKQEANGNEASPSK